MASLFFLLQAFSLFALPSIASARGLFREYIGAEFNGVTLADVPVNSDVEFHFILAFAIDYTTSPSYAVPTNGNFNVFWDDGNITPSSVAAVKRGHGNVKVAVSLGGDSVNGGSAYFTPSTVDSWVANAISSLTRIIKQYDIDGIDIDYEHFHADPATFAECIGRLIMTLKNNKVISFASIAPYEDDGAVQSHYIALWKKYGHAIDYVNFQFYAYDAGTTVSQFLSYFNEQKSNYNGGKILASFATEEGTGGLTPAKGFFQACSSLQKQGKLGGIFVWSADTSMANGFIYEKQSQTLIAGNS